MTTIGDNNLSRLEGIIIAHIEHGASGEVLRESVMQDIPKRWLSLHDGAIAEIEQIIRDVEFNEKK